MDNIDDILSKENLNYEDIEKFLEKYDETNYYKILHKINRFDGEIKNKVCKEIIIRAKNENIVDRACLEIITFIEYNYEYYKEVIEIVSKRNYQSTWITEIKNKLIQEDSKTMQVVLEDFSLKEPENIDFDIEIINRLLYIYDEKYIDNANLSREQIIIVCTRLNCIMSTDLTNILKIFYYFDTKIKFCREELERFLLQFFFDFPYICKKFIENDRVYDNNSVFIKYLKEMITKFDEEEKMKFNMKIFHPDVRRMNQFRKCQLEQNKEINKNARKYSVILNLCKSNTILYGKRYGITVTTKDEKKVSVGNMHQFKYEYPYPLSYIIDPVEYMIRINSLKVLGKEE